MKIKKKKSIKNVNGKKTVFETKEEDNKEAIRCIEICQQDLGNAYFNQF